jgi:hypothetical protein
LVDDGEIDVVKSTNDVFKEEYTRFTTNDVIIGIILVLVKTDGVFCISPERNILIE